MAAIIKYKKIKDKIKQKVNCKSKRKNNERGENSKLFFTKHIFWLVLT